MFENDMFAVAIVAMVFAVLAYDLSFNHWRMARHPGRLRQRHSARNSEVNDQVLVALVSSALLGSRLRARIKRACRISTGSACPTLGRHAQA